MFAERWIGLFSDQLWAIVFLVMYQVYYPEQEKFTQLWSSEQVGDPTAYRSVSAGLPHSLHQLGHHPCRRLVAWLEA